MNKRYIAIAVVILVLLVAIRVFTSPLGLYVAAGLSDGDWLNDWLTHLPGLFQDVVLGLHGLTAFKQVLLIVFLIGAGAIAGLVAVPVRGTS